MMRTKMTTTATMTTADKPRPFVREDPAVRRENLLKVVERLRRGWKQRLNKQANPPWQEWELELVKPVALVPLVPVFEVLYEGTRGPGKTDALLMDFAQHVGKGLRREWRGILFRQTFPELSDVVNKSKKWFPRIWPKATFNEPDEVAVPGRRGAHVPALPHSPTITTATTATPTRGSPGKS
jgi:hypothetical protein